MASGGLTDARNRGDVHQTQRKGPIGQRELLKLLRPLIDASMRSGASRTRDDSRAMVRRLLAETRWRTPFILVGLGARRCRYLSSLGYVIDSEHLTAAPGAVERVVARGKGRRRG